MKVHGFRREKFLARRVTIRMACFFFNPCHTTLFSAPLASRESFTLSTGGHRSGKLCHLHHRHHYHWYSCFSSSVRPLHPSEYHSANVDLHPFSVSSGETTCPPDETFRMFATSISRLVRPRFFDLSRSRESARGTLTSLRIRLSIAASWSSLKPYSMEVFHYFQPPRTLSTDKFNRRNNSGMFVEFRMSLPVAVLYIYIYIIPENLSDSIVAEEIRSER